MRTTIDLPDELYRTLKTRAAIGGVTMRELVQRLIEQGLIRPDAEADASALPEAPPVIIPATGAPIEVAADDIHQLEEQEDLDRLGRSFGR